mmetsp:Transcript_25278/g.55134  ORF Transcript_25278/g.55134 Transcript_25278/m.55134 type:complete len:229 (+) Transcript_25278:1173-1859(+)
MLGFVMLKKFSWIIPAPIDKPSKDIQTSVFRFFRQCRSCFSQQCLGCFPNIPLHGLVQLSEACNLCATATQKLQQRICRVQAHGLKFFLRSGSQHRPEGVVGSRILCQTEHIQLEMLCEATQNTALTQGQQPRKVLPKQAAHQQISSLPWKKDIPQHRVVNGTPPLLLRNTTGGHVRLIAATAADQGLLASCAIHHHGPTVRTGLDGQLVVLVGCNTKDFHGLHEPRI